jgi:hypothetical protein
MERRKWNDDALAANRVCSKSRRSKIMSACSKTDPASACSKGKPGFLACQLHFLLLAAACGPLAA